MEHQQAHPWALKRRVLPQHTDHAGVMWHGAYLAWLEEARVEALAAAGLAYADLSARGLELPVVGLNLSYKQALLHGDLVEVQSQVLQRQGVKLPWHSRFIAPNGSVAAEASVDLVLVHLGGTTQRRRLLRHLPDDFMAALKHLQQGPRD